jgi:hypothetical protein
VTPLPARAVCRMHAPFPQRRSMAGEMDMDLRTKPARDRAAHYEQEAEKFRRMAEAEPIEHIRHELLGVAEQYQRLADSIHKRQAHATN